jgi:peroxiredoxin
MALTASTMLALGTKAPDFQLPEVSSGEQISLHNFSDKKALLVMFICRHCPFIKHIQGQLSSLGKDYSGSGLAMVAISSNDAEKYPDDSPESLSSMSRHLGFSFPLLYDETQAVAQAFTAACTPDFFLFDRNCQLVYRGQLDDSRPGNGRPITGSDLRNAIDAALLGKSVSADQKPSIGCNIKWKPGNEPSYF